MELSGILFLVLAVAMIAFFIFALVKGFSTWGVYYTIVLAFLFILSLVYLGSATVVAYYRIADIRTHDRLKAELAALQTETERLKYGELNRPASDLNSLLPLVNELSRLSVDRGRVWRGARVTEFRPEAVRLAMAPVQQLAQPVAGVALQGSPIINGELPAELLVYAFGEMQGIEGRIVPNVYLGEYFVAESQGGNVLLRPLQPLIPQQVAGAQDQRVVGWSIFELMPLDSHEAFAVIGSKRTNDAEFGRMDAAMVSQLLNVPLELSERYEQDPSQFKEGPEARKARLLRSYLRDGSRAPENEDLNNVWLRIEFVKEYSIDVDSPEQRNASEGGYFDSSGRTVDARLKRPADKGPVVFSPGQQVVFGRKPAEALISQGIAKLIEPIFVRPINDYVIAFKEERIRFNRAIRDAELVQREMSQGQATNKLGQEQVVLRQAERELLDSDFDQYAKEQKVIGGEVAKLESEVAATKTELSRLYRSSQDAYERLVKKQRDLSTSTAK